jgi:alcohol dehydrogenase class IV
MHQEGYFGNGRVICLEKIVSKEKAEKIFLVCGKDLFKKSGAKDSLRDFLNSPRYKVRIFSGYSPNPKVEEIKQGLELFEAQDYDMIVAIGGGSSIDVAKAIKLFAYRKTGDKIPLVAIPTTAGTGSESTHFVVYYAGKNKISSGEREITLPDYFICDPLLIKSLPKKIKASSAIDALSQAIESYWSVNSNRTSVEYSRKAIKQLISNIEGAVLSNDETANKRIMLGANLSGKAIDITETTASHALSYPLTSYFGIPHGHAVGIILPEVLEYNFNVTEEDCNDKRGSLYVRRTINEVISLLGAREVREAKENLVRLMRNIGLETRLSDLNVDKKRLLEILGENNYQKRMRNNPRRVNQEGIRRIIEKSY